MANNKHTSVIVDALLKVLISGGTISIALLAPNSLLFLDKPIGKYLDKLDKRSRQRELDRILVYMRKNKLVDYSLTESYQHGISVTRAGEKRAQNADFAKMKIKKPKRWDGRWRLVFYDIPEPKKATRNSLKIKLQDLGFSLLQRSIWIHPYPCREIIEQVSARYEITKCVTYVEIQYIDNENFLKKKFKL